MPNDVYVKIESINPKISDIIVFHMKSYKGNLIKYVVAIGKGEYCGVASF